MPNVRFCGCSNIPLIYYFLIYIYKLLSNKENGLFQPLRNRPLSLYVIKYTLWSGMIFFVSLVSKCSYFITDISNPFLTAPWVLPQ